MVERTPHGIFDRAERVTITFREKEHQIEYRHRNRVKVFNLDHRSSGHCLVLVIERGTLHWDEPAGTPITGAEIDEIKEELDQAHKVIDKQITVEIR